MLFVRVCGMVDEKDFGDNWINYESLNFLEQLAGYELICSTILGSRALLKCKGSHLKLGHYTKGK
jgi:hypothetical protein